MIGELLYLEKFPGSMSKYVPRRTNTKDRIIEINNFFLLV
jgi:hypothetical protein